MTGRASCAHEGQHYSEPMGDPFQVDSHQPLPVGRPAAQDRPQNTDAGVQAEDVDGAETVAGRLDGIEPGMLSVTSSRRGISRLPWRRRWSWA
ncbi:hypothetical protein SGRIM119S_02541 [Streptomyces griseorubiginosus]